MIWDTIIGLLLMVIAYCLLWIVLLSLFTVSLTLVRCLLYFLMILISDPKAIRITVISSLIIVLMIILPRCLHLGEIGTELLVFAECLAALLFASFCRDNEL